jgi:hypothetical protein
MLYFGYYATPVLIYCNLRRHLVPRFEGDDVRIVCVFLASVSMIVGVCWNQLVAQGNSVGQSSLGKCEL